MPVEQYGLGAGEQGVLPVHVVPARLDHAERRIGEGRDRAAQEVGTGNEVGVEDDDQLAARLAQTGRQGPRLEALAPAPANMAHRWQRASPL